MALPTTGINTTHVRNAIGESLNKVKGLLASPNVNYFGFNSPSSLQNNNFWGKADESQTNIGYPLGAFRGYDHDWITRMYGGTTRVSPDDPTLTVELEIIIPLAAGFLIDKPDVSVDYVFSVEFSRTNNFAQGGGTLIIDHATKSIDNTHPYFTVTFSPSNPPDGGAALQENDTFYINVIHHSSPSRRWYITGQSLGVCDQGEDNYIESLVMPQDPYTYALGLAGVSFFAAMNPTPAAGGAVTISADVRTSGTIDIEIEMDQSDSFANTPVSKVVAASYEANDLSQAGTTRTFVTSYQMPSVNWFSLGKTIYYRYRKVGDVWSITHTTTVQDVLPPLN